MPRPSISLIHNPDGSYRATRFSVTRRDGMVLIDFQQNGPVHDEREAMTAAFINRDVNHDEDTIRFPEPFLAEARLPYWEYPA